MAALGNAMNGVLIVLVPQALEIFTCTVPLPLRPTFTLQPARAGCEEFISRSVRSAIVGGMSREVVFIMFYFRVALDGLGFRWI